MFVRTPKLLHPVLCAETSVLGTDSMEVQSHLRAAEAATEMATPLYKCTSYGYALTVLRTN